MPSKPLEVVLVVEDDPGIAKLQRRRLERAGYSVVTAQSASEALTKCVEVNFDLALLDYRLSGDETGLGLYAQLKQAGHTFPVILVTGFSDEQTIIAALRAGVSDFVMKSAEYLDFLPETVERVLRQARLEKALRDSEARFRALTDVSPQIVWESDPDGNITYVNNCWCDYSGLSKEETFGKGWIKVIHPDYRDRALTAWRASLAQSAPLTVESPFRRSDGTYRWHVARGVPIRNAFGTVEKWIGVATDIHDYKAAEAALREKEAQLHQAQKLEAIGRLAGGVAHEYNNLLQAIVGYANFALDALPDNHPAREELRQIHDIATRAGTLSRQLLGFSRREVLQRKNLDPNEQVTDLVRMLRPLLGADIELRLELTPGVDLVNADSHLIQQMLLNLCVNARDAMPSGGRLTIGTRNITIGNEPPDADLAMPEGRYVLFTVSDTGFGISPTVRERLFEPFFTTKRIGRGTGLGLAMVYGVVQQHEGTVRVDSELDQGSIFRIYLPSAGTRSAEERPIREKQVPEKPIAALPLEGTETVLVADDDTLVRDIAVRILRRAGYQVLSAEDGDQAIKVFEAHSAEISLALLDGVMPGASGAEVAQQIRRLKPTVPVIICSGHDPDTRRMEAVLRDGVKFLQKPFDRQTLLDMVREALHAAEAESTR